MKDSGELLGNSASSDWNCQQRFVYTPRFDFFAEMVTVMPKAKTHKGISKRFKVTGSGKKAKHRAANRGHILGKKSGKRKRQLRSGGIVCGANARMIVEALRPSL